MPKSLLGRVVLYFLYSAGSTMVICTSLTILGDICEQKGLKEEEKVDESISERSV